MTHHTDAERAAYERELIDNHHYVPSDFYFKDGFYGGDDDYIQFGWDLWQAAHRAPATPVPLSEPVAYLWQHCETGRTRVVMPDMVVTADANWIVVGPLYLAAAPQPPEVAPVQLPEPVAFALEWTFNGEERGMRFYDDETHCRFDAESDGGVCQPLYTEQQVRELLAAHGIQEQST